MAYKQLSKKKLKEISDEKENFRVRNLAYEGGYNGIMPIKIVESDYLEYIFKKDFARANEILNYLIEANKIPSNRKTWLGEIGAISEMDIFQICKFSGEKKVFHDNGKVKNILFFKNGNLIKTKTFFRDKEQYCFQRKVRKEEYLEEKIREKQRQGGEIAKQFLKACERGDLQFVKENLCFYKKYSNDFSLSNYYYGMESLKYACKNGHLEIVKVICEDEQINKFIKSFIDDEILQDYNRRERFCTQCDALLSFSHPIEGALNRISTGIEDEDYLSEIEAPERRPLLIFSGFEKVSTYLLERYPEFLEHCRITIIKNIKL